jgi:hypothetical protein
MNLTWQVNSEDAQKVKDFLASQGGNRWYIDRIAKVGAGKPKEVTKDEAWRAMIYCLLTTQQNSSREAPITRFHKQEPYPLSYPACVLEKNLVEMVTDTLTSFGGIRRTNRIADELATNFHRLEDGTWDELLPSLNGLCANDDPKLERSTARQIAGGLKGFGPKQSRNLLVELNLARTEIPIDSRIIKWLNNLPFPIHLNQTALSDPDMYELILDGFQALAKAADVLPTLLDAAIFGSFDPT